MGSSIISRASSLPSSSSGGVGLVSRLPFVFACSPLPRCHCPFGSTVTSSVSCDVLSKISTIYMSRTNLSHGAVLLQTGQSQVGACCCNSR